MTELGADEILTELEPEGSTYEVIIDAVGGPTLGAALGRVAPRGTVVNFGATTTEPVSYPTRTLFSRAPGAKLYGLYIFSELARTGTGSCGVALQAEFDIAVQIACRAAS